MSKYGQNKKSTNKFKSANPIFEEWISEWRDEAVARDLQSKHTYMKCLNSLKKYPLPLKTGKECVILEGFGDKICKLIDEKLDTFLKDGGKLHEDEEEIQILSDDEQLDLNDDDILITNENNKKTNSTKQIVLNRNQNNKSDDDQALAEINIPEPSLSSKYPNLYLKPSNQSGASTKTTSNKTKPVKSFEDNLSQNENEIENDQTGAKKKQKSSRSKEYMPEFRSGAYALLITLLKNEESNQGNGEDFMLKNQLIKEAQKHCDSQFTSSDPRNHYTAWNSMSNLIKKGYAEKENKLPARYKLTDSGRDLARKLLHGVDSNLNKNNSDSDIETEYSKSSKISKLNTETKSPKAQPIKSITTSKKFDDCIEIIDSDSSDSIVPLTSNEKKLIKIKKISSSDNDDLPEIDVFKGTSNSNKKYNNSSDDEVLEDLTDIPNACSGTTGLSQQFSNSCITATTSMSQSKAKPFNTYNSSQTSSFVQRPDVLDTLQAGSFDIILYVDNCEQSHAKRQDLFIDELKKSNIKFEAGKLHVGDFTWIARSKNGSNILNSDLILNYIVERKRMDDLCQSIIDGRYKEQKFRLKKCGITNQIYLIEEYGSMKHMSLPEKSLVQADVNTQLIDHLVVHHTTDPKDSAFYLIQMTKYLTQKYKNVNLNACLKKELDEYNKKTLESKKSNNSSVYLMTFQEFNEFSNKNKPLTIKEMFAKCLMKIQGVSQEKCLAIIEQYPTPSILIKEYSKCSDESSRIKLLSNLKYGSQQRNIGPVISKIIAQLFYTNAPLA